MSTINPMGGAQVGGPLAGTQQVASGALEALSSAFLQILGGGGGEGAASGISPSADTPPPPPAPPRGPIGTAESSGLFGPDFLNSLSQMTAPLSAQILAEARAEQIQGNGLSQ